MSEPKLLDVPRSAPNKAKLLRDFKNQHDIQTHRATHMAREDHPWLALRPFAEDDRKDIGTIMAESCRLYEEAGQCATGTGELTAMRTLCQQLNIPCNL